METTLVTIIPDQMRTRLLAIRDGREVLKAVLPPSGAAHRDAPTTFLEGLALWQQRHLSVVLCVDEQASSCDALMLSDALGVGTQQLHFDVAIAHRQRGRSRHRLSGLDDFRELRQFTREAVR